MFKTLLLVIVASAVVHGQSDQGNQTLKLGNNASPPASIANVAWIAGHWKGAAFGGLCDEIWSQPEGNSMVGMFRLVKAGKPVFYELMTIVEENNSLVLKLKHFGPDLSGWEEKTVSQNFPLVRVGLNEAFFNSLTYRRLEDGSLQIFVVLKQKSGEMAEQEFRFQPATPVKTTSSDETTVKDERSLIRTHALKLNVDDMEKALAFYVQKLGFEVADRTDYPRQVTLKTDDRVRFVLNKVERLQKSELKDTQVGLTLQVNDLDQTISRMKSAGVSIVETEPRKEAVGNAITILDPFGRKISLMHQTIVKVDPFKEPRIYNFGLLIPDMNVGREFYADGLGFVERSEKYLPLDLPLGHKDKSFGFMLHYRPGVSNIRSDYPKSLPYYNIVFETDNLEAALATMTKKGIEIIGKDQPKDGKPRSVIFRDPFGNISELEETSETPPPRQ